jgi:hypothetical protein
MVAFSLRKRPAEQAPSVDTYCENASAAQVRVLDAEVADEILDCLAEDVRIVVVKAGGEALHGGCTVPMNGRAGGWFWMWGGVGGAVLLTVHFRAVHFRAWGAVDVLVDVLVGFLENLLVWPIVPFFRHLVAFFVDGHWGADGFGFRVPTEFTNGVFGDDFLCLFDVDGSELETVEEAACAFGVHAILGDSLDDFADGELNGGGIFEEGYLEVGRVREIPGVFGGVALEVGVEVEIAVGLAAEGGGAAFVSRRQDVTAFEVHGCS